MNSHMKTLGISLGLLGAGAIGGLVVGLAAGVLLAPKAGRESRESVRRGVGEAWDKGQSYVDRIRHRGNDAVEEVIEH